MPALSPCPGQREEGEVEVALLASVERIEEQMEEGEGERRTDVDQVDCRGYGCESLLRVFFAPGLRVLGSTRWEDPPGSVLGPGRGCRGPRQGLVHLGWPGLEVDVDRRRRELKAQGGR